MKIFYAVQATGNGHISRAMEILPYLERYGQVDLFLSGANSTLPMQAPVKYRSEGLCFFYSSKGGLDYAKTFRKFAPWRILKEVRDLPVDKYDLVINDFESITALACAHKKVPSVNFGHQASFVSDKVPRPERKNPFGEWILHNYARASQYVGLHFNCYDNFILPPIIKRDILQAEPHDRGHITVYLPSYSDVVIRQYLSCLTDYCFQVFSREVRQTTRQGNITFIPVGKDRFNRSLIGCAGIIANAGFETPAEALYLGKKLLVMPIHGQYEQLCNAAALSQMGVPVANALDRNFEAIFHGWMAQKKKTPLSLDHSTESIISFMMHHCTGRKKYELDLLYPDLTFN